MSDLHKPLVARVMRRFAILFDHGFGFWESMAIAWEKRNWTPEEKDE